MLKNENIEKQVQRNNYIAFQRMNEVSQKLVEVLNQSLEYVEVLELIIKMNPNNPVLINTYAEMILQKHDIIVNVAIAPNGIVEYIYPTEVNKKAIGHNLMIDRRRNLFINKAIDEKVATIQGPVEAIQGGILIFNRKAIFMRENDMEKFWGLCVVSIDFEKVMDYCGIIKDDPEYYFSLKAPKSDGFQDFIWGNTETYTKDSITNIINFQNQKWELSMNPKQGWRNTGDNLFNLEATDALYLIMSFILFMFVLWHLNQYSKNSMKAKIDIMTGALNKSTFQNNVIKNLKNKKKKIQAIIVMDLNDFKLINDTYGHLSGDCVIIELSKRLMKTLRSNDLLARWGGDEFVVYLDNLNDMSDINNVIKRIYHEVEIPIEANCIQIKVTVALGYALYPNDGVDFEELYEKADIMMYSNKPANKKFSK